LQRLGGSADLRYWVVDDLADAIGAAAAQNPLAIVLEDIHAGGPAVQETLSVLQRADASLVRVAAMSAGVVADMVCDMVRANADASLLNLAARRTESLPGPRAGRGPGRAAPTRNRAP
jgi:hypothetical protein